MHNSRVHRVCSALCAFGPRSNLVTIDATPLPFPNPHPRLSGKHHTVVCIYECVFIFLIHLLLSVLCPTHKRNHIFLTFSKFASMIFSRSIIVVANGGSISSFQVFTVKKPILYVQCNGFKRLCWWHLFFWNVCDSFQNAALQSSSEEDDALKLHAVGDSLILVPKGR